MHEAVRDAEFTPRKATYVVGEEHFTNETPPHQMRVSRKVIAVIRFVVLLQCAGAAYLLEGEPLARAACVVGAWLVWPMLGWLATIGETISEPAAEELRQRLEDSRPIRRGRGSSSSRA